MKVVVGIYDKNKDELKIETMNYNKLIALKYQKREKEVKVKGKKVLAIKLPNGKYLIDPITPLL